jgi:hypothetical protein
MNKPIQTDTSSSARGSRAPTKPPALFQDLDFPTLLDRMAPVERVRAYRSGAFDRREVNIWAARSPEEAPLLNGEFDWIARDLADLD